MQYEVTPESEVIAECPNCKTKLSLHKLDDRFTCPVCWFAYGRDYETGEIKFAFESWEGDMIGEKYLREPVVGSESSL